MDTAVIVVLCLMAVFCVAVVMASREIERRYYQHHPPDVEEEWRDE